MAYKNPEYKKKWYEENKEDQKKKAAKRYVENKEFYKAQQRKYRYGITKEEYNALFEKQQGCCAICGKHQSEFNKRRLCVDHDHQTNEVRGLLCIRCNTLLGIYENYKSRFDKYLADCLWIMQQGGVKYSDRNKKEIS